jgi:hypothetical protein
VVEEADQSQAVGAFLAGVSKDDQGSVIARAEELKRGGVLKRVDVIFLGEFDGIRGLEGVDVDYGELDDLGGFTAFEKEGGFGVFYNERLFLGQDSLPFGGFRFTRIVREVYDL